jgi:hypothetical protein
MSSVQLIFAKDGRVSFIADGVGVGVIFAGPHGRALIFRLSLVK